MNLDSKTLAKELVLGLHKRDGGLTVAWRQLENLIKEVLDEMIAEERPKHSKLHLAAFALETVAHMKGLEEQLLPPAEFIRKVDETLKCVREARTAIEISSARFAIEALAKENQE